MASEDYDPVKARSSFLSTYMSQHKDTLIAYVMYYGKSQVHETPVDAKMVGIDQQKMNLAYQLRDSAKWHELTVEFDPPLSGYDAAKTPPLTTFALKPSMFNAVPVLLILAALSAAPYEKQTISRESVSPALRPYIDTVNTVSHALTSVRQALPFTPNTSYIVWGTIGVIHVSLALLVVFLSLQRHASLRIGSAWVLSTLLLSYPAVFEFRSHLQAARIQSIHKTQ
ncbi:hypothetical protein PIIN_05488 [Serendipita indica DSM 11827]|uniref:DUF2470 domain-containing protein n=1 Tax=Serendipita indica (strain DSM 11827) TaxID=1109443 RepID=G4TJQ8_SERID|nr:hypothetical protein PIIN_05488 [Serendipita indica DSM 11827]